MGKRARKGGMRREVVEKKIPVHLRGGFVGGLVATVTMRKGCGELNCLDHGDDSEIQM